MATTQSPTDGKKRLGRQIPETVATEHDRDLIEEIVAEDDLVAMRVTLRGTHEGPLMGIEPTGNTFEIQNQVFTRIEDGKIAERWLVPDMLGMLTQLELVDAPESSVQG